MLHNDALMLLNQL